MRKLIRTSKEDDNMWSVMTYDDEGRAVIFGWYASQKEADVQAATIESGEVYVMRAVKKGA
jgi:hypothetical protein